MSFKRRLVSFCRFLDAFGGMEAIALCSLLLIGLVRWVDRSFGAVTPEQLLFHLRVPLDGADPSFYRRLIRYLLVFPVLTTAGVALLRRLEATPLGEMVRQRGAPRVPLFLLTHSRRAVNGLILVTAAGALIYLNSQVHPLRVIGAWFEEPVSTFFEEHYVDPRTTSINFPAKPRNLVLVFLESIETSYARAEIFGSNLIPGLTGLGHEGQSFAGFTQVSGTGWTIAGMVGVLCGMPLLLPIHGNAFDKTASFLPSALCLPDLLAQQGYENVYLQGASRRFAGKGNFLLRHGIREENLLDREYFTKTLGIRPRNSWGIDDRILLAQAERVIERLARGGQPFFLSLLTVDTHHPSGFVDAAQPRQFGNILDAVVASDRMTTEFVDWMKRQPFFADTTVVIIGDHLSMRNDVYETLVSSGEREPVNVIINSAVRPIGQHHRFSHFDWYPTILESMGVEVAGGALGLGVSLFGTKGTLAESMPLDRLDRELGQRSAKYEELLFGP